MPEKRFWVYILASKPSGVLYVGVTSDLLKRIHQHRMAANPGFTAKYYVKRLVYFEEHGNAEAAILREKRIKKWYRSMKIDLVERSNPAWDDLYPALMQEIPACAGMTEENK